MSAQVSRFPEDLDLVLGSNGYSIFFVRQILANRPPIHAMLRDAICQPVRQHPTNRLQHRRLRFAEQLETAEREWISLTSAEIEIIYYHRLLKYGGIAAREVESEDGGIQMRHVISTDQVG